MTTASKVVTKSPTQVFTTTITGRHHQAKMWACWGLVIAGTAGASSAFTLLLSR